MDGTTTNCALYLKDKAGLLMGDLLTIDGEMLMNLDQESSKCLRMCRLCAGRARDALDAFDTPAVKRIRERWTLPALTFARQSDRLKFLGPLVRRTPTQEHSN